MVGLFVLQFIADKHCSDTDSCSLTVANEHESEKEHERQSTHIIGVQAIKRRRQQEKINQVKLNVNNGSQTMHSAIYLQT